VPPDVACIRCGYVLTGLNVGGLCPECGTDVMRSMSEDRIADADPAWLTSVIRGLGFLAWGPIVSLIAGVALVIVIGVESANAGMNTAVIPMAGDATITTVLAILKPACMFGLLAGLLMAAIGGVLVTAGEPRDVEREQLREPRVIARWGLVVAVLIPVTSAALEAAVGLVPLPVVESGLNTIAFGAGGFGLSALHARLHGLAIRIPSPTLATRCEAGAVWYRKWTRFIVALLAAAMVAALLEGIGGFPSLVNLIQIVLVIGGCVMVVVLLMSFFKTIAVLDLSLAVREQIRQAVARTTAGGPAP
jgi:hypothetical protein